jgi:hypothetical protein
LASAQENEVRVGSERLISRRREDKRPADADALVSNKASIESKPAPHTLEYAPGYFAWAPSETGASHGCDAGAQARDDGGYRQPARDG